MHPGTLVPAKPAVVMGVHYPATDKWDCPVLGCPQGRAGKGAGSSWDLCWHFPIWHELGRVRVAGNNWFPCQLAGIQMEVAGVRQPTRLVCKTCRYMQAC